MIQAVIDHGKHTAYSDPGAHRVLLEGLPTDPEALSVVARNVIVHYRASGHELPEATRSEVNSRWLERILAADQSRHPADLTEPREVTDRVQGCCRDHTLFCVASLRAHGIPARSRVGFAGYFTDGWHHDHVIVEAWYEKHWRRFDPEVDVARPGLETPMNFGPAAIDSRGFVTAAQVWAAYRNGDVDADTYGVDPSVPVFRGPRFVFDQVIFEVAHRFGDELLLWDGWGRIGIPGTLVSDEDARWMDRVAELLLAADAGDLDAEQRLLEQYHADDGLHPGTMVVQESPFGDEPISVSLQIERD